MSTQLLCSFGCHGEFRVQVKSRGRITRTFRGRAERSGRQFHPLALTLTPKLGIFQRRHQLRELNYSHLKFTFLSKRSCRHSQREQTAVSMGDCPSMHVSRA